MHTDGLARCEKLECWSCLSVDGKRGFRQDGSQSNETRDRVCCVALRRRTGTHACVVFGNEHECGRHKNRDQLSGVVEMRTLKKRRVFSDYSIQLNK